MTKNNEAVLYEARYRNGYNLNPLTRIYGRASLVPAAAVIPAPIVYIEVAAVKKLVVGSAPSDSVRPTGVHWDRKAYIAGFPLMLFTGCLGWLASLL